MLYNSFPREVSRKRRIVHSWEELRDYVNAHNGKSNMVSTSLYSYGWLNNGKPVYETAMVDKLLFDFDPDKGYNPLEEARKLDRFLEDYDVKRLRILSGSGLHIVLSCTTTNSKPIQYPTASIKNAMQYIQSNAGIMKDDAVGVNANQHVRMINTWNGGAQCFCIPLTDQQFRELDLQALRSLAKKQQPLSSGMFVGSKSIDLSKFDEEYKVHNTKDIDLDDIEVRKEDINKNCMMCGPNPDNRQRFIIISSLVELAYSKDAIAQYLSKVWNPEKYNHCIAEGQLDIIYDRAMVCYNCHRIKDMGYCTDTPDNPCPYEYKD
ncbi:MAG: hypothetical protein CI952_10 [Methanohalophilus sp.]|nr:MAG: hypothetical protein CI952_10 [Methanohalophilus sp.]